MITTTGFPHLPASAAESRAVETTRAVLAGLFKRHGPRGFAIHLWGGQTLPAVGGERLMETLVDHDLVAFAPFLLANPEASFDSLLLNQEIPDSQARPGWNGTGAMPIAVH